VGRNSIKGANPMASLPESVAQFLRGKRFAVAGVSRTSGQAANAVYCRLKDCGYEVFPINPNAVQIEGVAAYPDLGSIPVAVDGVVIATHPSISVDIVRQCRKHGVARVCSTAPSAVAVCPPKRFASARLVASTTSSEVILSCFCGRVDFSHECMRWWPQRRGHIPR